MGVSVKALTKRVFCDKIAKKKQDWKTENSGDEFLEVSCH